MIYLLLAACLLLSELRTAGDYSIHEVFRTTAGDWSLVAYKTQLKTGGDNRLGSLSRISTHFQMNTAHLGREMWSRSWKAGEPGVVLQDLHLVVEPDRQTAIIAYKVDDGFWLAAATYEQILPANGALKRSAIRTCIDSRVLLLTDSNGRVFRVASTTLSTSKTDTGPRAHAIVVLEDSLSKERTEHRYGLELTSPQMAWFDD